MDPAGQGPIYECSLGIPLENIAAYDGPFPFIVEKIGGVKKVFKPFIIKFVQGSAILYKKTGMFSKIEDNSKDAWDNDITISEVYPPTSPSKYVCNNECQDIDDETICGLLKYYESYDEGPPTL